MRLPELSLEKGPGPLSRAKGAKLAVQASAWVHAGMGYPKALYGPTKRSNLEFHYGAKGLTMLMRLDGVGPRYSQITRALGGVIQSGELAPGARVPPTRDLARDLGCSRNIVLLAYEQLTLEGYLVTRRGAGTFVSPDLPKAAAADTGAPGTRRAASIPARKGRELRLSLGGRRLVEAAGRARRVVARRPEVDVDFMYGLCRPDARLIPRLRTAFAAAIRQERFGYFAPAGDLELRAQVAERLRGTRGILRPAEQILITNGAQQALDICARLLVGEGDRVVVEDPGYEAAHAVFAAAGATLVRVPVDKHGLQTTALPRRGAAVRLVYVTPSHQFPTGAIMPAARRYALLDWAARRGAYVIEDDYDGEYRYTVRPIEALSALEPEAAVIYCGTFAKSLFPAMRLGYLALPRALMPPAVDGKWLSDRGSSALIQRMMAVLMATGEYDRHIRRMQRRYRARREALIRGLHRHLGPAAQIDGSDAGLHIVVWLPEFPLGRLTALVRACADRRVGVYSMAPHFTRLVPRAGLVLGYGLVDPPQIEQGVQRLAEAYYAVLGDSARTRPRRPGVH